MKSVNQLQKNNQQTNYSWGDVYIEAESSGALYTNLRIITLTSHYIDTISEKLVGKKLPPQWDDVCNVMRSGNIYVKEFVHIKHNDLPVVCINRTAIDEDTTYDALRMLIQANQRLSETNKDVGLVFFGSEITFQPEQIPWFYHH